jgi:hypothetical protein
MFAVKNPESRVGTGGVIHGLCAALENIRRTTV